MLRHQPELLAAPRRPEAVQHAGSSSALRAVAGCTTIGTMPGASFTSKWYRNPERLMSLSERLPS